MRRRRKAISNIAHMKVKETNAQTYKMQTGGIEGNTAGQCEHLYLTTLVTALSLHKIHTHEQTNEPKIVKEY